MTELERLLIKLEADTEQFRRALQRADKVTVESERKITRGFDKMRASTVAFAAAAGAALTGMAIAATQSVVRSGLAMERIQRQFEFVAGSAAAAREEFDFVRREADRLGLALETSATNYAKLTAASKGTELQGQKTRDIFSAVAEAGAVLGMTDDQIEGAFRSIEQMISKGNVQAEELRGQLGERLPGAFQIAARAMGVTTEELNDMLERGDVAATDMLPKLAAELHKTFGPSVEQAANSTQAAFNRLHTAIFELQASLAESGLLDFLARVATKAGEAADAFGHMLGLAKESQHMQLLQERLELESQIRSLNQQLIHRMGGVETIEEKRMMERLTELTLRMNEVDRLIRESASRESAPRPTPTGIPPATGTSTGTGTLGGVDVDAASRRLGERLTREVETSAEKAVRQWREVWQAHQDGLISDETLQRWQDKLLQPIEITAKRLPELMEPAVDEMDSQFADLGESMGQSLLDSAVSGMMGIETQWDDMIRRMLIHAGLQQLLGLLGSLGGPVGSVFSFLGFGKRAAGGPVMQNQPVIVGERRPEIFIPHTAGRIEPRVPSSGGGMSVYVDARHATDPAETERAVERGVRAAVQIAGAQTQAMIGQLFRPAMA